MPDVTYEHAILGDCVISFDGRVAEHFTWQVGSASRVIVGLLEVTVKEPDRKGRITASVTTRPNGKGGGFTVVADQANWALVEPVIREIAAAGS